MSKKQHKLLLRCITYKDMVVPSSDLERFVRTAQELGWQVAEMDGKEIDEVCEGCSMPLVDGPGLHLDADNVPLCDACWNSLIADAKEECGA